jgi:hypothetical protein
VVVIQTRDLNDPQAVRLHLRNIAQAIARADLVEPLETGGPIDLVATSRSEEMADSGSPSSPPLAERGRQAEEALAYRDERCRLLVRACVENNRPLPEVGHELRDGAGRVCAEAELAWPTRKLAVVLPKEGGSMEAFRTQGWEVLIAAELTVEQLLDLLPE